MVEKLFPTTVVGSYPQPDWLVDRKMLSKVVPRVRMKEMWRVPDEWLEQAQDDATIVAIHEMERAGIDVITNGEIRRESYSNRFATALEGVDIDHPGFVKVWSGAEMPVHRVALHRLCDRLGITEVILLSLRIGPHILRGHQPGIVTKCRKPATEVMGAGAGLHAKKPRRHIGQTRFHLAARPPLPQHDRTAFVVAYNVKRVLTGIDADNGDLGCLRHDVLLVFGAPASFACWRGTSTAGPSHWRTRRLKAAFSLARNRPATWSPHTASASGTRKSIPISITERHDLQQDLFAVFQFPTRSRSVREVERSPRR